MVTLSLYLVMYGCSYLYMYVKGKVLVMFMAYESIYVYILMCPLYIIIKRMFIIQIVNVHRIIGDRGRFESFMMQWAECLTLFVGTSL